MKTRKQSTVFGIVAIIVIAIAFVACEPDHRKAYYGTWYCAELFDGSTITINSNMFKIITSHGDWWWQIESCTWEMITNSHVGSKNDFPVGYKLTGTESNQSWTMGEGNHIWIYLHTNKQNLIVRSSEQSDPWMVNNYLRDLIDPWGVANISLCVFMKQ